MFGKDYKRVGSHQTILLVCNGTTLGVFIIQERVGDQYNGEGISLVCLGLVLGQGPHLRRGRISSTPGARLLGRGRGFCKLEILFRGIHSIAQFIRNIYGD